MALQHLRSSTADKRPTPAAMSDGQLALNTNLASPGLFFKDSNGDSVKIGPVHVGTTAPNVTPGAGGQAGNSKGEAWLDTTATNPILKVWNGSAFVAVQPVGTGTVVSTTDTGTVTSTMILDGTIVNADINASAAIVDTKLATIATAGKVSNSATTATNANTASAIVARDASGNFSAGTITAALTGAASSNVLKAGDTMTGALVVPLASAATPSLTFTGDLNTGIYSPGANQLAVATNGTGRLFVDASGRVGVNAEPSIEFEVRNPSDAVSYRIGVTASDYPTSFKRVGFQLFGAGVAGSTLGLSSADLGAIQFLNTSAGAIYTNGAAPIVFGTTNTERLRITSAGLVGIGTSAPTARLHLSGTNTAGGIKIVDSSAALAAPGIEVIGKRSDSNGSSAFAGKLLLSKNRTDAAINSVNFLGSVAFGGNHTDGTEANILYSASIAGISDGAFNSATDMPTALVFNTGATGRAPDTVGVTTGTERLRITSAGNVGIGTTSPGAALEINAAAATSPFIAKINTSEFARIDSSGRLLVGTSSARTGVFYNGDANAIPRLQIEAAGTGASSSASAAIGIVRNSDVAGAQPYLAFARTRGTTLGSASVVSSGDGIGTISFQGADGTDFVEAASITAQVDGTPGANDMPGRLVFSTTADGASSPTERVRLTNTGALLVGTTTTPTGAGSGAVVAEDRMVISSINAGRHQVIAGDIGTMTATTGTVVFKFTAQATTPRSCYVKLAIANRGNNNTPSNLPAAEYAFQLHRTTAGVCSLNGATTVFEFTYVYATHVAFADLGSGECTVTLTNPTVLTQIGSYKVEVLTAEGIWTLDSVTTT
jgi:hypothetical protein